MLLHPQHKCCILFYSDTSWRSGAIWNLCKCVYFVPPLFASQSATNLGAQTITGLQKQTFTFLDITLWCQKTINFLISAANVNVSNNDVLVSKGSSKEKKGLYSCLSNSLKKIKVCLSCRAFRPHFCSSNDWQRRDHGRHRHDLRLTGWTLPDGAEEHGFGFLQPAGSAGRQHLLLFF